MKNLKTLKIKDTTFLYKIVHYDCGEYGSMECFKTFFYNPRPIIKTRKKYWLWGPEIKYAKYEELFTLDSNIESHDLSKKYITKIINEKIALLNRKNEIERGEIIEMEEVAATHIKQYTDKDMVNFVSFVGKNYIKSKGFYYMKGDFEKKRKVSIHKILENFNVKNLEDKKLIVTL